MTLTAASTTSSTRRPQDHPGPASLEDGEEYYLGVFLVGAYQETLGDLHNLMGDTNVVSIRVDPDGGYEYVREIRGDSVADILSYVEYDPPPYPGRPARYGRTRRAGRTPDPQRPLCRAPGF